MGVFEFNRVALALAFAVGGALSSLGLAQPARAADPCPIYNSARFLTANWNQSYAGVPTTVTVQVLDPGGCITGATMYFNAGGDSQSTGGSLSRNGNNTVISGSFTPKSAQYTLNIDYSYWFSTANGGRLDMPTTQGGRYTLPSSGSFQPMPVPSSPGVPMINANNRTLEIGWAVPASNSGAVARYSLKNASTGAEVCSGDGNMRSCTIPDVADGSYTFVVSAVNSQGNGGTSGASDSVRVAPPDPPQIVSAKVKASTATLWVTTTSGTTAVGTALRLLTVDGREVWSRVLSPSDVVAGSMQATVRLQKGRAVQFVARLETPLGNADSTPTRPLKPLPVKRG
jgi:hypothetical protein